MRPFLTVVAGPTASGKTTLAIALARRLDAEVVSADSQAVYRGFDLGTAKPTAEEQGGVPHHLVSHVAPTELYSAARFHREADAAIGEIAGRGKRIVVVGGSGLYLRVLLHGVVAAPGRDEALREGLEAFADAEGDLALHQRLQAVDPETAAKLPVPDRLRVIRALELHTLTGTTASQQRSAHAFEADRYAYRLWVLTPPRATLYERINARARAMFDAGLLEETKGLVAQGFRDAPAMRSVGYVQALACLDGTLTRDEAIADLAQKTRHFAKRQLTWFKKEKGAVAIESAPDVEALARATLEAEGPPGSSEQSPFTPSGGRGPPST